MKILINKIKEILKKKFTKQYAELDLNNWRKNYG